MARKLWNVMMIVVDDSGDEAHLNIVRVRRITTVFAHRESIAIVQASGNCDGFLGGAAEHAICLTQCLNRHGWNLICWKPAPHIANPVFPGTN